MKKGKRIDKINSLKRFFLFLLIVSAVFCASEFVLQEFTPFGDALNNLEYYAGLSFSEKDVETAKKAREDLASLGAKIIEVPGTLIYRYKKAETESFSFNSFGFRGREPSKKGENEYRIGVFGCSKVLGIYLAEENTIPFIIQQKVQREFPQKKITVFNMGIEGYDLQRAVSFAEFDGERLELDMMVFYSNVNDINYSFKDGNIDWEPFRENEEVYQNLVEDIATHSKKPFWERSLLRTVVKEAFLSDFVKYFASFTKEQVFQKLNPAFERRAMEFAEKFNERIRKASEKFEKKGIKTVFFFPPIIQLKEPLSKIERNMLYKNEMSIAGYNNYFIKCAEGVSESENPVVFSQKDIFRGYRETAFFDGIHFTPEASRIVGNDAAGKVLSVLKKEKAF